MPDAPEVAQIGVLESSAEDLAEVEDADEGFVFGAAGEEALEVIASAAADIGEELFSRRGRIDPWPVELTTVADEIEKVARVGSGRGPEDDAIPRFHLLAMSDVSIRWVAGPRNIRSRLA
jgi:hypothetical protein